MLQVHISISSGVVELTVHMRKQLIVTNALKGKIEQQMRLSMTQRTKYVQLVTNEVLNDFLLRMR